MTFKCGKIKGRKISSTAPSGSQVLSWNSSSEEWEPSDINTSGGSGTPSYGELYEYNESGAGTTLGMTNSVWVKWVSSIVGLVASGTLVSGGNNELIIGSSGAGKY